MYEQIETDKEFIWDNGEKEIPVATLADEHGGRCQIAIDDHCYIIALKQPDGKYTKTPWIFKEAFKVLTRLPVPR